MQNNTFPSHAMHDWVKQLLTWGFMYSNMQLGLPSPWWTAENHRGSASPQLTVRFPAAGVGILYSRCFLTE